MAADTTSLHLRLPKALYKKLQREARRNNVSLNTEIVNQLEGHEAATAERLGEIVRPWIDEAVRAAATDKRGFVKWQILDVLHPKTEAGLEQRLLELRAILDGPRPHDEETRRAFAIEIRSIEWELLRLREARARLSPTESLQFLEGRLSELKAKMSIFASKVNLNAAETEEMTEAKTLLDAIQETELKLRVIREAFAKEPQKK
jgi:hypothetical protein